MTETIITAIITALCTGGLTWLFTLRYTRKQAEADAMKSVQEVYQELIEDMKNDRKELKQRIDDVESQYRELQQKCNEMEKDIRQNARVICFAACFYGCRSPRSVTRKTVTEATGEEKQTTTDGVIELARRDSSHEEHVLDVYREDSTHIRIDYDSLGRIKEIDFSNRKTEKRTGKNQSSSLRDHKETTSQTETAVTRKSDVKQQSQEKEKTTNGCSLWTFLKFMFFFLSFCLVHDNWASIKNFIRRLWKK